MPGRRGRPSSEEEIELRDRHTSLRKILEKEFRPIFKKHGSTGIMLSEFRRELEEEGVTDSIPPDRLNELLFRADRNSDKYITYNEFIALMTGEEGMSHHERSTMIKFVGLAIENIVPRRMQEDFLSNYNCHPPPIFMFLISIIEIIIFVVYALELKDAGTPVTATSGVPLYSPLIYTPKRRYEAWRYLTYMFIHQGYLHLVANLIFQLLLGLPLEVVHKYWRVLIIYFCGVIAGSLAHSVTDTHVLLAGASGGCYALIGGHLASIIVNWKEMNYKCCEGSGIRFLLSAPVRLSILLILAGADTGNAVYRRFSDQSATKVGISAHIGGLLAGLLLGIPVLKNIHKLEWEKTLGWVTLAVYLAFVAFAIFFNGLYQDYPKTDWS